MKKKIILLTITLGALSLVTYLVMDFLCKVEVKCRKCIQTSKSRERSQENGLYLMDYTPIKSTIKLANHDLRVEFREVWVETQWLCNSDICLRTKLEQKSGYNIVFEFEKSEKGTFLFSLSPILNGQIDHSNGGIMESKKEIRLNELTDTLWLQVQEKNPREDIGWSEEIDGEIVGFIRK